YVLRDDHQIVFPEILFSLLPVFYFPQAWSTYALRGDRQTVFPEAWLSLLPGFYFPQAWSTYALRGDHQIVFPEALLFCFRSEEICLQDFPVFDSDFAPHSP